MKLVLVQPLCLLLVALNMATVSASTKPITTFFIIYPFQVLRTRLRPSIHCLFKFTTRKLQMQRFRYHVNNKSCSVYHYNFCELALVSPLFLLALLLVLNTLQLLVQVPNLRRLAVVCPFIAQMIDVVLTQKSGTVAPLSRIKSNQVIRMRS